MTSFAASQLLRENVLDGVAILLARAGAPDTKARADAADARADADTAGADSSARADTRTRADAGALADAVEAACAGLGARVDSCRLPALGSPERDEQEIDEAVAAALARLGEIDMLVVDAAGLFAAARSPRDALMAPLQSAWSVTRAVANAAFIERRRGGRIVLLAPAAGAGAHADAAGAGLENLARTLSIEWARYDITPVAIAPGARTPPEHTAAVVAYLASPAGAYFSGCLLDLRGPAAAA